MVKYPRIYPRGTYSINITSSRVMLIEHYPNRKYPRNDKRVSILCNVHTPFQKASLGGLNAKFGSKSKDEKETAQAADGVLNRSKPVGKMHKVFLSLGDVQSTRNKVSIAIEVVCLAVLLGVGVMVVTRHYTEQR